MPWIVLLETFVTIVLAAGGVFLGLNRHLNKLDRRLDKMEHTMVNLCGTTKVQTKRLKRVSDIIMVELSTNDGESMKDRLERLDRLITLMEPE